MKAGRGLWRSVFSSMTSHPDFQLLTPPARLTLLILRVGGQSTIAGIGRVYTEPLTAETGLTPRRIRAALAELSEKPTLEAPWIVRDGNLVWVRNALRFDPNLTLANVNHKQAVQRAVSALPASSEVVQHFRAYYRLPAEQEDALGPSHQVGDGVSQGGIRSSSSTPNSTPSSTPSHGGSLSLVSSIEPEQPGNGSGTPQRRAAPGEYQQALRRIQEKHPRLTEAQAQDEALHADE